MITTIVTSLFIFGVGYIVGRIHQVFLEMSRVNKTTTEDDAYHDDYFC